MLGLTQQQIAEKVGIKFQQISKYEMGINRLGASLFWEILGTLSVTISLFFDGLYEDNQ